MRAWARITLVYFSAAGVEAMASSQAQAEITERRLRPLYDAIDNGQNKKALQIADKIIKKQEDLFCAKALKAIVCQRMGRQEEGNALINEVVKSCPGDQATLQATTMYYRETGDEQKVVDLYSRAAQQYPGNQEILTHLFMAFVRVGNYQRQQQTALLLHKAFPDNGPYYCWRVMSIIMQAQKTNDGNLASSMFLPLAEKLMEKYVSEKKLDIEEGTVCKEVKLYLLVLDKLGKTEKRLEVIKGRLGRLIRNKDELNHMELECYLSLHRWDDAVVLLTQMLQRNPDQWSHLEVYISCQIQRYKKSVEDAKFEHERKRKGVAESNGEVEGEVREVEDRGEVAAGEEVWEGKGEKEEGDEENGRSDENLEEKMNQLNISEDGPSREIPITPSPQPLMDARDFLEALRDQQCSTRDPALRPVAIHPVRGPFLGRLELHRQITQSGLQNVLEMPSASNLLMDYFAMFGTKGCCFDDIKLYFEYFSADELKRFMAMAEAKVTECPINFDCPPEDTKYNLSIFRRQISLMQLQRYCGYHKSLTPTKKRDLIMVCKHMYKEGLKLSRGVPETESKPADFFAVLAVHMLMEIYVDTKDWSILWQCILLLEHARSMHSTNAQVMLLLMRLYGYMGAAKGVTDVFESLNIKHLQMETLGYIPLRYLQSSGAFGFANQLYRSALRFYYSCAKETSEYIIQAYKNGMFQKILEFVNLRDKLTHSLNFACTLVDMNLLEIVTSIHSMEKARQFFGRDWFNGLPSTSQGLNEYCSNLMDSRDLTIFDDWSRAASSPDVTSLTKLENKLSSELEVLWLRVRVMLVQCLKEAVVTLSVIPAPNPQEVGGERGEASDAVVGFNNRVSELSKSLTQMSHHMGMLVLQQKKAHLLPIQTSPPCLGMRFHQCSYGNSMLLMFSVVERLAIGGGDIREKLNEVLQLLRSSVTGIRGIPEALRDVVIAVVKGGREEEGREGEEGEMKRTDKTKSNLTDPLNLIPTMTLDLEQYSLFLSVVSYIALISAVCVEMVKPPNNQSRKKKKKQQQQTRETPKEHPSVRELASFMEELCDLVQETSQAFQPFPSVERELINLEEEIRHCQLPFEEKNFEQSLYPRVSKLVLESFNMSLEDSQEVVDSKLKLLNSLLISLGGNSQRLVTK